LNYAIELHVISTLPSSGVCQLQSRYILSYS